MRVGVFSPNDPRPWVREDNIEHMLTQERLLVDALRKAEIEVIRGGEGQPKADQIAWSTRLVQEHVKRIADAKP